MWDFFVKFSKIWSYYQNFLGMFQMLNPNYSVLHFPNLKSVV